MNFLKKMFEKSKYFIKIGIFLTDNKIIYIYKLNILIF